MIGMSVSLARASLFDAASENDFTLLEDHGEYFVSACNRVGPYREFVQALFDDHEGDLFHDLVTGDVRANFIGLMEVLAMRWGDEFSAELVQNPGK
jgi:hypothetical protein